MTENSPISTSRRTLLQGAAYSFAWLAGESPSWAAPGSKLFPKGFLWGAATAGHQVEGNNTNSDTWFMEQVQPTVFAEPSGDACNSFELWRDDLALISQLNLNSYRFSIEWARIEPEPGQFSVAMLDHYLRIIEACRAAGIQPLVTFNHFTAPRWFSARGGWTHAEAPQLFARYCERAARHLAGPIAYATTLNEPDLMRVLQWSGLPPAIWDIQRATLQAAARALGVPRFVAANVAGPEDLDVMQTHLLEGHKLGRAAIKAARSDLPVGVSLAIVDDQAVGAHSRRDEKRKQVYGAWLEAVRQDDFVGVQNYERARIDEKGTLPPPDGTPRNSMGSEIYPPSLANAVRYVHEQTGRPILVSEHGLGTVDDAQRAAFIPAALSALADTMSSGVPVLGYMHWSLIDNFEWIFGYKPRYGLYSVDRQTFKRTAKGSAQVLASIARANAVA